MIGAEPQFGNLRGMSFTHKISARSLVLSRLYDVIDSGAPYAGPFEAKVIGKLYD